MLVLRRELNEEIVLDVPGVGVPIVVKVLQLGRETVLLGFAAPADVKIHRVEVWEAIQRELEAKV